MSDLETNVIHTGDCFDVLADPPAESVHAVVTDPPYGLAFMGRDWDDFEPKEYQEWCEQWATEVKRVLKPGGHLLAFSSNRTHHRLFAGVEDAGFEIRDTITWHYGSGFPKASDISKTIDKRAGIEPDSINDAEGVGFMNSDDDGWNDTQKHIQMGEPATDAAKKWDGFKTGLKPATEYVVMARKPFDGATVDSVLEHGTGALNIEACRIDAVDGGWSQKGARQDITGGNYAGGNGENAAYGDPDEVKECPDSGRYPSNVVFDEIEAERLDRTVGDTSSSGRQSRNGDETASTRYTNDGSTNFAAEPGQRRGDSGGPSRYFYTSKASKAERTEDGSIDNAHPTVKPQDLMEWLVKLVTAESQIVLDPFCGSGTTLKAAKAVGRQFIGIERQPKWADVARVRAGLSPNDPSHVRDTDDNQQGLEQF